jgi:hypothetical protein
LVQDWRIAKGTCISTSPLWEEEREKREEERGKRSANQRKRRNESTRAVGQNPTHHQVAEDLLGGPKSTDPQ